MRRSGRVVVPAPVANIPARSVCQSRNMAVQVSTAVTGGQSYALKLTNHESNSRTSGRNTYTLFDDVIN